MAPYMDGIVTHDRADIPLFKATGAQWVREGLPYPFEDRLGGKVSAHYAKAKELVKYYADNGIKVMASVLQPGVALREPDATGELVLKWHDHYPKWYGALGTEEFLRNLEATAEWLAKDLKGMVQAWQVGNELDWLQFAGPMNPRQACDFILRGAKGIKRVSPEAIVGHNMAGCDKAYFFFAYLFGKENRELMDYCGIDGYYGSWSPGKPEDWAGRVKELNDLSGAPVVLNEWGFGSSGGAMTEEERRSGVSVCQSRKWSYTWGPAHTPEGQAEFVTKAFAALKPFRDDGRLMGQFYFRWADQPTCWQCGKPGCPAETAWGLVDLDGKPKPSYEAYKRAVLG
jgi:hypothetical protein